MTARAASPLLSVEGLVRDYLLPRRRLFAEPPRLRALDGVDFEVHAGRSFGIVGESGCGKSTLARTVVALERPTAGAVRLLGRDPFTLPARELKAWRRDIQMVFQDPYGSLDPRQRVARIVAEPLDTLPDADARDRAARRARVAEALEAVGLRASDADKYPHEFSGGQRQRVAIARALITRPKLIVADEAVSALDVSVQAQVLNLMTALQDDQGVTFLFISHDLSVVDHVTEDVAVMYLGRIVERGATASVLADPAHPYTRALVDAVPVPDPARGRRRRARADTGRAKGDVGRPPSRGWRGCAFAPRCPLAVGRCRAETPALRPLSDGRAAACHLV